MTGRFVASSSPEEVRRWFRTTNPLPNFNASYNVAPTDSIPVVRFDQKMRERSLDLLHCLRVSVFFHSKNPSAGTMQRRCWGASTRCTTQSNDGWLRGWPSPYLSRVQPLRATSADRSAPSASGSTARASAATFRASRSDKSGLFCFTRSTAVSKASRVFRRACTLSL
jgi:hypothetical protein